MASISFRYTLVCAKTGKRGFLAWGLLSSYNPLDRTIPHGDHFTRLARFVKFQIQHLFALIALVAVVVGIIGYGQVTVCDCFYDLIVHLNTPAASEVRSISYVAVSQEETADAVLKDIGLCQNEMVHQAAATSLKIPCFYSFRIWGFGQVTKGSQSCSHMVVVLHMKDGTSLVHKVNVPPYRESHQAEVNSGNLVMQIPAETIDFNSL